MGICELRKATEVFEHPAIGVRGMAWEAGEVARVELFGGVYGYCHVPKKPGSLLCGEQLCELPVEFFNHELMDVDPLEEESVFAFVSKWGFPYTAFRSGMCDGEGRYDPHLSKQASRVATSLDYSEAIEMLDSIGETENLWQNLCSGVPRELEWIPEEFHIINPPISFSEASLTLLHLQSCCRLMFAAIESEDVMTAAKAELALEYVNLGSCNANQFNIRTFDRRNGYTADMGSLTSAICNQIIESHIDPAPWRRCANNGGYKPCTRIFKRSRTDAKTHDADAIYCCSKCANNARHRKKKLPSTPERANG